MDRRRQLLLLKAKLIIIQLMEEEEEEERNRKKPRVWVRPLWLTRPLQGESETAVSFIIVCLGIVYLLFRIHFECLRI